MRTFVFICALFFPLSGVFGQLPSKVERLVGTWRYKGGNGYEMWYVQDDQLIGRAYRINPKTKDSSHVEDSWIRRVNKHLVYTIQSYTYKNDSLVHTTIDFIGGKRQLDFENLHGRVPQRIRFSFGLFSRKRLTMKIWYEEKGEPVKLQLTKVD